MVIKPGLIWGARGALSQGTGLAGLILTTANHKNDFSDIHVQSTRQG